jgi:hypothetical protein
MLMTYMLCRNRVADFAHWKTVFASHATAHRDAGLRLVGVWRSTEEPNNVFFMFDVASMDRAMAFMRTPGAEEGREASGVLDGEFHFVEDAGGY